MTELTITHTAADGTLLEGTRKGDGAWEAIKEAQAAYKIRGWRYFPSIRAIGVSHSRDRAPKLGLIDRTADVLREAGFTVAIEIEAAPRAMEEAEADRAARMSDRADALHDKAERKDAESDARFAAADQTRDLIPFGQPILVGHHSEKRHRRDLERMHNNDRKGIEAMQEAKLAESRAVSAERHMEARNNPRRVYRRIEKLQADRRRVQRSLDGHTRRHLRHDGSVYHVSETPAATGRYREQLEVEAAHLDEQIRYWTEAYDAAKAEGGNVAPEAAAIQVGYWVKSWAGWRQVMRVNKKTVTVWDSWQGDASEGDPSRFQRKITLDDVKEIRESLTV